MQKLVFTNGGGNTIDLTSGYYGITNWEGLSGVGLNIQTQQVPFQDGGVFLDALMEQREISVTVAIQDNNDLSARYERKRELISALNPKLGEGVLVYTNDYLSRQIKAVPQLPIFENKNSNDAGTLKASVVFSCPSPYWEDLEDTVVLFSSEEQPTVINRGDISAQVKMEWVTSNVTNGEIFNIANNKKIKYEGLLQNGLKINTNIGEKSVVEQTLNNMIVTNTANFKRFKFVNYRLFCLGEQGSIMTSENGKSWQAYECPFESVDFRDVCYNKISQTYYFAGTETIGSNTTIGVVIKLDNQNNWTKYNLGSGYAQAIIYISELGLYLTGGTVLNTSSDGATWTERSLNNIQSFIYEKNIIIATTRNGVYSSTDGINWTKRDNASSQYIAFSEYDNLFVITSEEAKTLKTSSDGITWNSVTFTNVNFEIAGCVYYIDELKKYICLTYNLDNRPNALYISFNGTTWIKKHNFDNGKSIGYDMCFDENLGLLFSRYNNGYATSTDGENWEYVIKSVIPYTYTFPQGTFLQDVVFGQKKYIAVLSNNVSDGKVVISENGIDWRLSNGTQFVLSNSKKIIYSENKNLFIVGTDATSIATSPDGESWVAHSIGFKMYDILETENELCGCGVSSNNSVSIFATSSDGVNWSSINITNESDDKKLNGIAWSKSLDLYVVVGNNGMIFTSSNKTTWTPRTSGTNENLNSVLYSEIAELFIAVGDNGTILTSLDGITWSATGAETKKFNRITYSKLYGSMIIVGDNGIILTSIDGLNWTRVKSDTSVNLYGITMGNNLVAVGGINTILTSEQKEVQNAISKLSTDSDINFNLNIGRNRLRINKTAGDMNVTLSFRQKYIGV